MAQLTSTGKWRMLPAITILTVVADQVTKHVILATMRPYEVIGVIPGFFNIVRVHNPGGAFGFMAGHVHGSQSALFLAASLLAACLVLYLYKATPLNYPCMLAGLSLIFGGAMGNLIDRVRFGAVIDFLDFHAGELHWPAFNVADSAITIGLTILVFHIMTRKEPD
ncbi:MAG: signal peptidase II [Desulfococcus sp. 4484_241]|nr:MAG: signal peptidase II [Desulfococcus sp. 4484_241]